LSIAGGSQPQGTENKSFREICSTMDPLDAAARVVLEQNAITDEPNRPRRMTRILALADFEPCRLFISSLLHERPGLQVVCEVSDGLQAVERAQELKPHVILMDIGLPGLNGIDAARRILTLVPHSKIIFLTQESSLEAIKEAINLGACGYVLKSQAQADLLAAVEAVLQGRQFFNDGSGGHGPYSTVRG
jgi:CheY-like chemotaxis protein